MTIKKKSKIFKTLCMALFFGLVSNLALAESAYEQKYSQWKAEQARQDQRLKNRAETDSNHYLSRPSTSAPSASQGGGSNSSSKIRLNSASVEQLMQLNGVGKKKAEAIIEYRNKNGKFNSVDDFMKIKGIGPALFNKNKAKLAL